MNRTKRMQMLTRAWDLRPGDVFRGRTIVNVHGIVGLACSPVAIIEFSDDVQEHPVQTRVPAASWEAMQHCDEVMLGARAWVRAHEFHEGEEVDLDLLRSDVMSGKTEVFSPGSSLEWDENAPTRW